MKFLEAALDSSGYRTPPMSHGPFSLCVIAYFIDPLSVTISISLIHGNALFHNLRKRNPPIYLELCEFVVLQTYPSKIILGSTKPLVCLEQAGNG